MALLKMNHAHIFMTTPSLDHCPLDEISFIILDFETITHAGHPPEPVELGALRILPDGTIDPEFMADWLIQPPAHTPMISMYATNMGLRVESFDEQPTIAEAL